LRKKAVALPKLPAQPSPDYETLRRALSIEARHHYPNLKGKQAHFADFVIAELGKALQGGLPGAESLLLQFRVYGSLNLTERAAAVQALHLWLNERIASLTVASSETDEPARDDVMDWRDRPLAISKGSGGAIAGVGPKTAERLARLNVRTVDDLLRYYPRTYLDFSQRVRIRDLRAGVRVTIWGTIKRVDAYNPPRQAQMSILTVWLTDGTGTVAARWFGKRGNKVALDRQKARFPVGQSVLLSGEPKRDSFSGRIVFDRPATEVLGGLDESGGTSLHVGRLVPVYDLTEGLSANSVRQALRGALDRFLPLVRDALPAATRETLQLVPLRQALELIHFPTSLELKDLARTRLAFDELLWMQLGLAYKRAQAQARCEALRLPTVGERVLRLKELLPFRLTQAQERVLLEIQADMAAPNPMNRLVQGDVGCGKTVVALLSLMVAIDNGYQGALMAPTEILAEQHYRKMAEWLSLIGVEAALLTGRTPKKERTRILAGLANQDIHLLIGTHALISDGVDFARLGLVVIDEQHRFGVKQRASLRNKGEQPEVLVMTATPIPRTLSLTVHGDLDVSIIDELPPGRKPVKTIWARTNKQQNETWSHIRTQLAEGRQCYVVYPLIEGSEDLENVKSAVEEHERLSREVFPEFQVALLHGQMKSDEKDAVMDAFRTRETQVLVSTTVIEVGVDVPNASVMVIENAERFGLAQLHQLRGRVGRGPWASYCYLFSENRSETTRQRLEIMEATQDGFVIAEQDLAMRGPGEFWGTRQSGLPDLRAADLVKDTVLLEKARAIAKQLIEADPSLDTRPLLKSDLFRYFRANLSFLEVG